MATDEIKTKEKNGEKSLSIEEIKKLPPQERLAKLKELEDKRKKEEEKIKKEKEEAQKVIDQSIQEINTEEEKKEIETTSEQKKEKEKKDNKETSDSLEQTLKKENIQIKEEQNPEINEYGKIKQLASQNLYTNLDRWQRQAQQGNLSSEYEDTIKELYAEVTASYNTVKEQMNESKTQYTQNEELLDRLITARKILKDIGYKTNWFRR